MPYKKKTIKRRIRRRPLRQKTTRAVPRSLRPQTIGLVREHTTFLNTKYALPTHWQYGSVTGYHTLQNNMVFTLGDLPQISELYPVFKVYKLNCIIVSICNLHNSSMYTTGSSQNYYGANVLCYVEQSLNGKALDTAITQDYWDQRPAKKQIILRGQKNHTFKIYPKVMSNTFITSATQTTIQRKPGWLTLSNDGVSVPHYGLNLQFSALDPKLPFDNLVVPESAAPMNFKITYRYLFQVRGLQ